MEIHNVPFGVVDWEKVAPVEHKGLAGTSFWRTIERGNIRLRKVEYSSGFESDHWCPRGHVGLVLEGELLLKLKEGSEFVLGPDMSFATSNDEANPHLVSAKVKTTVFLLD